MPFPIKSWIVSALFLLSVSPVWAHVALPSFFSDHMVLQRQMKIPVWGTASPGEQVTVTLDDKTALAVADANGQWKVSLPAMEAGGPYTMTAAGSDTATINDILIGEVWLFSGQSNMEWGTGYVINHDQEIPTANYSQIRLCQVPHTVADKPAFDVPTSWAACTPDSVFKFSAVAYFTGRELYKKLNVPIGLIQVSWSGTNIEGWMPQEALASDPDFQPLQDRWAKVLAAYPQALADYNAKLPELTKAWQAKADAAKAARQPPPGGEPKPPEGPGSRFSPAGIFNGGIHPLAPFALRGVVWYQGENNTAWAFLYRKELKALITSWRQLWGEGDMPFIVIQLPSVVPLPPTTTSRWAEIRESQFKALELPNTGLVVTIDLGDPLHHDNLHPKNKQDVGMRTALLAEKMVYGLDVVASGPTFKNATATGDSIQVQFDNADGLKTKDGSPIAGFEIAGDDKKYLPATATVDGNSVTLHTDGVQNPQTVRYDWANYPDGNLYNSANLPTRPFRTDDFTLETVNYK